MFHGVVCEERTMTALGPPNQHTGTDRAAAWERHLPLAGFASVALFVLTFFVAEVWGDAPAEDAPADEVAAFFVSDANSVLMTQFVLDVSVLFLLVFLASVFAVLLRAGRSTMLARLGWAAGAATATLMLASSAPHLAAVWASQGRGALSPASAETLWLLPVGIHNVAYATAAVMFATIGYLTIRTGALPRWFGWLTAVAAVVMLVPFIGWGVFPPVLELWVLVATVPVWRATVRGHAAEVAA
jgi:hypothetical protein